MGAANFPRTRPVHPTECRRVSMRMTRNSRATYGEAGRNVLASTWNMWKLWFHSLSGVDQ
jgi:hypothetical protein